MRVAAGVLLLLAVSGCGTGEAGSDEEQHCYFSYDGSYTSAPDPTSSPRSGCTDPR